MNLLMAAHAPWRGTGYATPVLLMAKEWEKLGHRTSCFAIEERGPGLMDYHGLMVALPYRDPFGMDAISDVSKTFGSDAIISLFDPWVLSDEGYSVSGLPWYAWFPVDQDKPPYHLKKQVRYMARPVVYSQYAAERIKDAAVIEPPIDLEVFAPAEKYLARHSIGMGHVEQLVGMVGSNILGDRKALEAQIRGFAAFAKGKPEIKLLAVTGPKGQVDLIQLVYELKMKDQIYFIDPVSRRYAMSDKRLLARVYQAMDVLLHASAAEGFGMCLAEAMACSIPTIYAENTSQPEVTGGLGYTVTEMEWKANPHGGKWQYPTPSGVAGALERWHSGTANWSKETLRKQAEKFSPAIIAAKWQEVLDGD